MSTEEIDKTELFSGRFLRWRARLGVTQKEAGKILGISRGWVIQLEAGKMQPGPVLYSKFEQVESMSHRHALEFLGNISEHLETGGGSPLQKLRAAMDRAGMDAAALAKAIHRDIGPVQAAVYGTARASEGMIDDFCRVLPGLEKGDLMPDGETLPILQETGAHGLVGQKPNLILPPGVNGRYVPLLSFAQAGRYDLTSLDEGWSGEGFIAYNVDDRSAFALRIEGDSMSPQISPGDVVVVAPAWCIQRGEAVVVKTTDGEVFCKIWGGERDGVASFLSNNPAHPPMPIPRDQIAFIYPVAQHTRNTRRP